MVHAHNETPFGLKKDQILAQATTSMINRAPCPGGVDISGKDGPGQSIVIYVTRSGLCQEVREAGEGWEASLQAGWLGEAPGVTEGGDQ